MAYMSAPNILFITTDHLRSGTLGYAGDEVIQTPAIDKLASESVRMYNCFVQNPVCAPSRATFMTGRYPKNHGVRWNGSRLSENEVTVVEHFKKHGYQTACVGKHHIGQEKFQKHLDHTTASGIRRGWSERADGDYTVHDPNPFEQYVRDQGYEYKTGYALPNFRANLGAVPSDLPEDCHIDAYVGMKSIEYLEELEGDDPFFLWAGFYGPHHPYVPSGRFATMYDPDQLPPFQNAADDLEKKPVEYSLYFRSEEHKFKGFPEASDETYRNMKAAYYGMVSQIDWQVGLLLDTLEKKGLAENTVVVFLSDHGEFLGDHGIPAKAPFLLDCMLRVPCLIKVPGQGAKDCDALVESIDLFPTLSHLAGIDTPECVQGHDLKPVWDGTDSGRDCVFAEAVDKRCIRTREWKYIHYPGKTYGELYNIVDDPHELNNVYEEEVGVRNEMKERFYLQMDATEDFKHPRYHRYTDQHPDTGDEVTHYMIW
jgi:arylsulfatase A-like enzyme